MDSAYQKMDDEGKWKDRFIALQEQFTNRDFNYALEKQSMADVNSTLLDEREELQQTIEALRVSKAQLERYMDERGILNTYRLIYPVGSDKEIVKSPNNGGYPPELLQRELAYCHRRIAEQVGEYLELEKKHETLKKQYEESMEEARVMSRKDAKLVSELKQEIVKRGKTLGAVSYSAKVYGSDYHSLEKKYTQLEEERDALKTENRALAVDRDTWKTYCKVVQQDRDHHVSRFSARIHKDAETIAEQQRTIKTYRKAMKDAVGDAESDSDSDDEELPDLEEVPSDDDVPELVPVSNHENVPALAPLRGVEDRSPFGRIFYPDGVATSPDPLAKVIKPLVDPNGGGSGSCYAIVNLPDIQMPAWKKTARAEKVDALMKKTDGSFAVVGELSPSVCGVRESGAKSTEGGENTFKYRLTSGTGKRAKVTCEPGVASAQAGPVAPAGDAQETGSKALAAETGAALRSLDNNLAAMMERCPQLFTAEEKAEFRATRT